MPDYVSSREFERFATRIDAKIDGMAKAQQKFFTRQSVINADVSNIKKKHGIVTTAIIMLIVGTAYNKVVTDPVINQHKEIPKAVVKPVTKDLIK